MEEFLDIRKDKGNQQDRKHGSLVTRLLHLKTEKIPVLHGVCTLSVGERCRNFIPIHQRG